MLPKAATPAPPAPTISGKWLIIGIFTLALAGAGGSWLFRYMATNRVAKYWQPPNAIAIRDAPKVTLDTYTEPLAIPIDVIWTVPVEQWLIEQPHTSKDVSSTRGLVHLRNALLEDQSFDWDSESANPVAAAAANWKYCLNFEDHNTGCKAHILLAPDSKLIKTADRTLPLSYQPIATGIAEMLAEFDAPPANEAASTRALAPPAPASTSR